MNLTDPIFRDEAKARAYFEALRWPNGVFCPHCGELDKVYKLEGKSHRPGLYHCNGCSGAFTVTTGTVMESSHLPLTKWALGFRLYAGSKKGFSAHQLHRSLGITYKSAWFMAHRIREAMAPAADAAPIGGEGKIVEADTTYVGGKEKNKHKSKRKAENIGGAGKQIVHTLIERDGSARSHHIPEGSGKTLGPLLLGQVDKASTLMTDTHGGYLHVGKKFTRHEMVDHGADEYVRGDAYTNTAEGYFSIFKRGMTGVYQHCGKQHLHRYLAEFDFRYSNREKLGVNDTARADKAVKGSIGKRLTYRRIGEAKVPD
jgi:transposase-like protein